MIRAGNGVIAVITIAIFSRILSPAEYGVYALWLATATVTCAVLFQWINATVGRFYPMHPDDPSKVLRVAAAGFCIAIALGMSIIIIFSRYRVLLEGEICIIGIILLVTISLGVHNLALQVTNARDEPYRYGLLSLIKLSGTLLFGTFLIYSFGGALGAMMGILFGTLLAIFLFGSTIVRQMRVGAADPQLTMDMLRYGWPVAINYIAITIVDVSDRFMIAHLLGVANLGPYVASYDFTQQAVGSVMNVVYLAIYPHLVRAYEREGEDAARAHMHLLGTKLVALGLPFILIISYFSKDISSLIYSLEYQKDAAMVMPVLACAVFLSCFKMFFIDTAMQLRQYTIYLALIALTMAALSIALNIFLLPRFGVIGAAWSTFFTFLLGSTLSWVLSNRIFNMRKLMTNVLKVIISCLLMCLAWEVFPETKGVWVFIQLFTGSLAYIGLGAWLNICGFREFIVNLLRIGIRCKS